MVALHRTPVLGTKTHRPVAHLLSTMLVSLDTTDEPILHASIR